VLRIVDDQIGAVAQCRMIAEVTVQIVAKAMGAGGLQFAWMEHKGRVYRLLT